MLLAHPLLTGPDVETFFFVIWNLRDFVLDEIPPDQMAEIKAQNRTSIDLFDGIARWMKDARKARVFIEKTPQHALRLSFLRFHFPRSLFIFVCRDPRDGFISVSRHPHMKPMTADQYAKLWRGCVRARLKHQESTRIFDVRYEDLCVAPERHLRRMMAFVGYDMIPEQLAPDRYSVTAYAQRPGHARLKHRITGDTVGEWRMKLTAAETRRFTEIAGPELRSQDYEA
jgi:hypothetical protein